MKKATLVISTLLFIAITLVSFKGKLETRYGGSASASGKVTYVTDYEKTQGRKVGDIEPIDVTIDCMYKTNAEAKDWLKRDIESKAATKKLKLTTSISYDVTSCEN